MPELRETETEDPRVRRTRQWLVEAILTLAVDQDFKDIRVNDITKTADVSRATFYLHYRDKHELIVAALDFLFEELTSEDKALHEAGLTISPYKVPEPLVGMLRQISSRAELFKNLLNQSGSSAFSNQLHEYFVSQTLQAWKRSNLQEWPNAQPLELRAHASAGAGLSSIRWWLECEYDYEIDVIAQWIWKQVSSVLFEHSSGNKS